MIANRGYRQSIVWGYRDANLQCPGSGGVDRMEGGNVGDGGAQEAASEKGMIKVKLADVGGCRRKSKHRWPKGLAEWQTAMQGGRFQPQSASTLTSNQNKSYCWFSKSKQKNPCDMHARWDAVAFSCRGAERWRTAAIITFQQKK